MELNQNNEYFIAFAFSPPIQFLITNDVFTNSINANQTFSIPKENLPKKKYSLKNF